MATAGSESGTRLEGGAKRGFAVPRNVAAALAGLVGLLVVVNYSGLALLVERWNSDSNYGHGYLIPFISLYFAWTKKEELRRLQPEPCLWGLGIFLVALPVRFLAVPLASSVFSGIALVLMINGLLLYLGGRRIYKALWLPALYLVFMVPLPQSVHEQMANPLQHFASWTSAGILDGVLGVPTMREGNVIKLAGHTLQVAEACSGMRSIMGLLALGAAFAYFWERPLWERLFLLVSAVPIAIVANICRVTGTGLIYHWGYEKFAQGFYHEFTGWFVFIFAMAIFLLEASVMSRLFVYDPARAAASKTGVRARGAGA
jgi:exosortase